MKHILNCMDLDSQAIITSILSQISLEFGLVADLGLFLYFIVKSKLKVRNQWCSLFS